jgi:hypothetical protein
MPKRGSWGREEGGRVGMEEDETGKLYGSGDKSLFPTSIDFEITV